MCLEDLHIANLKHNKSLSFELPSFRALITHLNNKVSIVSFGLMGPRPPISLFVQQIKPIYPSFNTVDHLRLIKNSGVKIYTALLLSLCLPYADEKSQG